MRKPECELDNRIVVMSAEELEWFFLSGNKV